jgi:hypothetical protein
MGTSVSPCLQVFSLAHSSAQDVKELKSRQPSKHKDASGLIVSIGRVIRYPISILVQSS